MTHSRDERLDHWVESRLLRRPRSKRFQVGAYSKYPNKALQVMSDMEMPFTLSRREDLKFEIRSCGILELADSWEDLALSVCRLLFRVVEGTPWPYNSESLNAEENL